MIMCMYACIVFVKSVGVGVVMLSLSNLNTRAVEIPWS